VFRQKKPESCSKKGVLTLAGGRAWYGGGKRRKRGRARGKKKPALVSGKKPLCSFNFVEKGAYSRHTRD